MNPLVTVIIPIYNGEKYLKRALDSVVNQTYNNIEIMLINDCSTDDSLTICKEYIDMDSRVHLINNDRNCGSGFGKNYGIEHESGDYFMFMDQDDYIDVDIINTCVAHLTSDIDIVTFGYSDDDLGKGHDHYVLDKPYIFSGEECVKKIFTKKNIDSNPWGKLYKKGLFHEIRFPLNTYYDDINVVYKVFLNANKVCITGTCGYAHMDNGESISGSCYKEKDWDFISQSERLIEEIGESYPHLSEYANVMLDDAVIWILMKYLRKGGKISKNHKKYLFDYFDLNFKRYMHKQSNMMGRVVMLCIRIRLYPLFHKIKCKYSNMSTTK